MMLVDRQRLGLCLPTDAEGHERYARWLVGLVNAPGTYGMSDLVLSSFVRITTHPRIFKVPSPLAKVVEFTKALRDQPHCVPPSPGPRHWNLFLYLCDVGQAEGNLVPDAYLAALAIESGSEWITADRDFARFPGLKWRHPLG